MFVLLYHSLLLLDTAISYADLQHEQTKPEIMIDAWTEIVLCHPSCPQYQPEHEELGGRDQTEDYSGMLFSCCARCLHHVGTAPLTI